MTFECSYSVDVTVSSIDVIFVLGNTTVYMYTVTSRDARNRKC